MTPLATPRLDLRPSFGRAIVQLLDGHMKDERDANGWTFVEQLACDMFLSPQKAAKACAIAEARARGLPQLKAAIDRAKTLNAPKDAIMARLALCKDRGPYQRDPHLRSPHFHLDFPKKLHDLDPERYGPWCYLPTNYHHSVLGSDGDCGSWSFSSQADHSWDMWCFRRDPHQIEGAWSPRKGFGDYLYTPHDEDECKTERKWLDRYRARLRLLLAEAVPGAGAL
jgi:hypothetical protein